MNQRRGRMDQVRFQLIFIMNEPLKSKIILLNSVRHVNLRVRSRHFFPRLEKVRFNFNKNCYLSCLVHVTRRSRWIYLVTVCHPLLSVSLPARKQRLASSNYKVAAAIVQVRIVDKPRDGQRSHAAFRSVGCTGLVHPAAAAVHLLDDIDSKTDAVPSDGGVHAVHESLQKKKSVSFFVSIGCRWRQL